MFKATPGTGPRSLRQRAEEMINPSNVTAVSSYCPQCGHPLQADIPHGHGGQSVALPRSVPLPTKSTPPFVLGGK